MRGKEEEKGRTRDKGSVFYSVLLKLVAGELKEIDGKGDELPERKKKEEEKEEDGAEVGGAYFGSGGVA